MIWILLDRLVVSLRDGIRANRTNVDANKTSCFPSNKDRRTCMACRNRTAPWSGIWLRRATRAARPTGSANHHPLACPMASNLIWSLSRVEKWWAACYLKTDYATRVMETAMQCRPKGSPRRQVRRGAVYVCMYVCMCMYICGMYVCVYVYVCCVPSL